MISMDSNTQKNLKEIMKRVIINQLLIIEIQFLKKKFSREQIAFSTQFSLENSDEMCEITIKKKNKFSFSRWSFLLM